MFEMVVREIDIIVGRMRCEQDFSDMIYHIWVNTASADDRKEGFNKLGTRLKRLKTGGKKQRPRMKNSLVKTMKSENALDKEGIDPELFNFAERFFNFTAPPLTLILVSMAASDTEVNTEMALAMAIITSASSITSRTKSSDCFLCGFIQIIAIFEAHQSQPLFKTYLINSQMVILV